MSSKQVIALEATSANSTAIQATVAADPSLCVFSVDVEDWFHILDVPSTPALPEWQNLPSRVETNFYRLLDIFSLKGVHVTCFFLGWVAERFPHLVKETVRRKHEIGSHGYGHRLLYRMTRKEFQEDVSFAKVLLEDISGTAVLGYRSPGFSATGATPWAFEELVAAGYQYDSSVFPAKHGHGGISTASRLPYVISTRNGSIIEFPISVAELANRRLCFFGGGYLRLAPYWVISYMAQRVLRAGLPVVFYIHPREIDPTQPRLKMSFARRFKTYVNVEKTEHKLVRLLDNFPVTSIERYLHLCGYRWGLELAA